MKIKALFPTIIFLLSLCSLSCSFKVNPTAPETGASTPVIDPNPADGSVPIYIRIPNRTSTSNIKIQITTLPPYRELSVQQFVQVPIGVDIRMDLRDRWGKPIPTGLYYVWVTVDGKESMTLLYVKR